MKSAFKSWSFTLPYPNAAILQQCIYRASAKCWRWRTRQKEVFCDTGWCANTQPFGLRLQSSQPSNQHCRAIICTPCIIHWLTVSASSCRHHTTSSEIFRSLNDMHQCIPQAATSKSVAQVVILKLLSTSGYTTHVNVTLSFCEWDVQAWNSWR